MNWYVFMVPSQREPGTKIGSVIPVQKRVIFLLEQKCLPAAPVPKPNKSQIVMSSDRKPFLADVLVLTLARVLRMAWNSPLEMEMPPWQYKDRVSSRRQWLQKRKTLAPQGELHPAACPAVALQRAITEGRAHLLLQAMQLVTAFRISQHGSGIRLGNLAIVGQSRGLEFCERKVQHFHAHACVREDPKFKWVIFYLPCRRHRTWFQMSQRRDCFKTLLVCVFAQATTHTWVSGNNFLESEHEFPVSNCSHQIWQQALLLTKPSHGLTRNHLAMCMSV